MGVGTNWGNWRILPGYDRGQVGGAMLIAKMMMTVRGVNADDDTGVRKKVKIKFQIWWLRYR